MRSIVLTTNSPGEVSAWVGPVVAALARFHPDARVSVVVPPCSFASGREVQVLRCMPGISQVLSPAEYLVFAVTGRLPDSFARPAPQGGVVVHLGGDFAHTGLVAKRLRMPAVAYTEGLVTWKSPFGAFCVPYSGTAQQVLSRGVRPERVHVVGNLMVDSLRPSMDRASWVELMGWGGGRQPYVLLVPGSRPYELSHVAPLFLCAANLIGQSMPAVGFVLALSPFADISILAQAVSPCLVEQRGPGHWSLQAGNAGRTIEVVQGHQHDAMLHADFALTIPGTNTAEMAVLRVPMLVSVPMNWPEDIPLEGLPGLVGGVPYIGRKLKAAAVKRVARSIRFTALPNRIAGRDVVPELRGVLQAEDIAERCLELLAQSGEVTRSRVAEAADAMGPSGAAERLVAVAEDVSIRGRG